MRCPGPPYHLGPHCWRDPIRKRHYKLRTHHLKGFIRHVEQGYTLQTHDDVPKEFRQQLYAEEQQRLERHNKPTGISASGLPPINITNVLPTQSHQTSVLTSSMAASDLPLTSSTTMRSHLDILGPRDTAVR